MTIRMVDQQEVYNMQTLFPYENSKMTSGQQRESFGLCILVKGTGHLW